MLDKLGQQANQHGTRLRFCKLTGHDRDGCTGCDFAEVESADAISYDKKKSVRSCLLTRGRDKGSQCIFIVRADFSEVAGLTELYVQHTRRRMQHLVDRRIRNAFPSNY